MTAYHFIGVGGIGMSALANIVLQKKHNVSGSDLKENILTKSMKAQGAMIHVCHDKENVPDASTVVYSSAISRENPEWKEAKRKNLRMIHRSELLQELMKNQKSLIVTGTHGKTTTSTLLATVLRKADQHPSFAIGGIDLDINSNSAWGEGAYFVAEGDESDGSFLNLDCHGAIITNLEEDHLDYYGSKDYLLSSFRDFLGQIENTDLFLWCGDDKELRSLDPIGSSYGFSSDCTIQILDYTQNEWNTIFTLKEADKIYSDIELSMAGKHNVLNAAAVFSMSLRLGVEETSIRNTFKTFKGISQRCEKKRVNSITLIDDYAHHPTEIKALLATVRAAIQEKKLIIIFQPHRYSRTQALLKEFATAFNESDELILTQVYDAGEKPIPGITSELLKSSIEAVSSLPVSVVPRDCLYNHCLEKIRPHDVVLTVGAGDITSLHQQLIDYFSHNTPQKYTMGLLYGGRNNEHEISIRSASFIASNIDESQYDMQYFFIDKRGLWNESSEFNDDVQRDTQCSLLNGELLQKLQKCDILFPLIHGPFGEDGSIQGFLETLGKPYLGSDYFAASICMDKVKLKRLVRDAGIPTLPFADFSIKEWKLNPHLCLETMEQLNYPLMVKPVHGGSSIGVKKAENQTELISAINLAFKIDYHILVEKAIVARELEFAILGNSYLEVPRPGEACTNGKTYDYDSKYRNTSIQTKTEAQLTPQLIKEGKLLAEKAYRVAGCQGFTRIDFFLEENGSWWLNEANPIPGLTSISLYPKIWENQGLSASELINRWVILGLERNRLLRRTLSCYEKDI